MSFQFLRGLLACDLRAFGMLLCRTLRRNLHFFAPYDHHARGPVGAACSLVFVLGVVGYGMDLAS
jgi:hypothetical protein